MKAVILAAGSSSRFKPISDNRHKALIEIAGKSIVEHTISELRRSGVDEIIVVQSPNKEIQEAIGDKADLFVEQDEPKGMGHALEQAKHLLEDEMFLVLTPYRARASQFFSKMIDKAENERSDTVFVTTETSNPEKYGILDLNEEGRAKDIVEKPAPESAPSNFKVVGMYLLKYSFFDYLEKVETWEYQFEDALSLQMEDKPASVLKIDEETNSVKYPWDLFSVVEEQLEDQERSISDQAQIADSAEIKGNVVVEEEARVLENAVIKGPAYVGKGALIGNNSLIRDYCVIEQNSTVGANAEVKTSVILPETSFHSGFLGDSIIGRNTKIGAGTVAANRNFRESGSRTEVSSSLLEKDYSKGTGRSYMGAIVGDNVDIGVNTSLMPGVQIGSGARIGPGTVVMDNVEQNEKVFSSSEKVRKS